MFYVLYNILSPLLFIPVCIYHLYRSVSRGRAPAFGERLGFIPREERAKIGDRPVIWLHAVSVGEAVACRPLLKALRLRYPNHAILLSTTTETGRGVASRFPEKDLCIYFPFDFLPAVQRALTLLRPRIVIIMETEIWPNFTREAARRDIPVILANGRISDRSFRGYLRFAWFFRHPLAQFSALCMQTETDRERICAIGAPPERTLIGGNLKYDIPYRQVTDDEKAALRQRYAIPARVKVLTAGSTHPGEEELVLDSYRTLLEKDRRLFLLLVPRHPERAAEVATLIQQAGIRFRRRTALGREHPPFQAGEALLVDTVGELPDLYALSDVVFVGGSLVPTGGHNLLEPAAVGVASIFGPHMTNFREIAELVTQYGAGIPVQSPVGLTAACEDLLTCEELRRIMGQNGLKILRDYSGACKRHMEVIAGFLHR
jgi:3-deoxy-D-manno-octulosonic-acid transferase